MPIDLRNLGTHLAKLAWIATRTFFGTLLLFVFFGIVLAGVSAYYLRDCAWHISFIGVVLAIIESGVMGFTLAGKRAVAMPLAHGLGSLGLGQKLVGLIFDRMQRPTEQTVVEQGPREMTVTEAERQLERATEDVEEEAKQGGWFRRHIVDRLINAVRKRTIDRFRQEGSRDGKIDVNKVRSELERTIDDVLVDKVKGRIQLVTWVVALALPILVALQTMALLHLDAR